MTALKAEYYAVAQLNNGYWTERHYPSKNQALERVKLLKQNRLVDVYMSVNSFETERRASATLQNLNAIYCDLDSHSATFNLEATMHLLKSEFIGSKVPLPSQIVATGRGLHLYWWLEGTTKQDLAKWELVRDRILNDLSAITDYMPSVSVDYRCSDVARVLRAVGTYNTKAKQFCKVVETHQVRYTLDDLLECFYDVNISDLRAVRATPKNDSDNGQTTLREAKKWQEIKVKDSKTGMVRIFNAYNLICTRLRDFKKLLELRNGHMAGMRDEFLTMYGWTVISKKDTLETLQRELEGINCYFSEPLSDKEIAYKAQYIFKRFNKEVIKGQDPTTMTQFDRYYFKNATIIKKLNITDLEQRQLETIISKEEKNRRDKKQKRDKRRNENGLTKREQAKADNIAKVQECKARGLSQSATKEETGLSLGSVRKYWNC